VLLTKTLGFILEMTTQLPQLLNQSGVARLRAPPMASS